jgi:hypothetical protein
MRRSAGLVWRIFCLFYSVVFAEPQVLRSDPIGGIAYGLERREPIGFLCGHRTDRLQREVGRGYHA